MLSKREGEITFHSMAIFHILTALASTYVRTCKCGKYVELRRHQRQASVLVQYTVEPLYSGHHWDPGVPNSEVDLYTALCKWNSRQCPRCGSILQWRLATEDMRYFSDYYKACTDLEVGWCNIPNKARLNPTEMMTAAYHKKTLVYAYKGIFNKNLDWHWSGGILLDPQKVVDHCTARNGVPPEPALTRDNWGGLSFDKEREPPLSCMYVSTVSI